MSNLYIGKFIFYIHAIIYLSFLQKTSCNNEVTDSSSVGSVQHSVLVRQTKHSILLSTEMNSLTIRDIIEECVQGQRILKVYQREKELTERNRNKICDIIITYFENHYERYLS